MNKSKLTKLLAIAKLVFLLGIILSLSIGIYKIFPELAFVFEDLDSLNSYLERYRAASIPIYILLQIIQVVVALIPGQLLQFAAGYVYGFLLGSLLSMLGIILGTVLSFYMARILGKEAMHVLFGEERITRFITMINSKRSYTVLFVLFLIPGLPKDLLSYAAGVSEIKLKPFLLLSIVGRTPALLATLAMSRMLYNGSYTELIVLIIISMVLFVLGIVNKNRLISWISRLYDKMSV